MGDKVPQCCTKCKHFVWCEFGKQMFYKITGKDCEDFEMGNDD